MPWVNKFDFGLLNAHAVKQVNNGYETAVLMSRGGPQTDAPSLEAIGRHPQGLPAWSTHTAIVNAIQRQATQGRLSNLVVFATYQPTVACIGMMKTHGLHSVTYWTGAQKRYMAVASVANVANIAAAQLPQTQNPNRINTPGGDMPPGGLLANPTATVGVTTARTYLTALALNPPPAYAAWRATWNANLQPAGPRRIAGLQQYLAQGGGFSQQMVDIIFVLFTYAVAGRVNWMSENVGSRIVGVLGNPQGQIYGWQVNQRQVNTTFHAETNLVQGLGQIPGGTTLYSTLEPCHQCAGLFVRAGGTRCVYGQNDPNMVNNTALAGMSTRLATATFVQTGYPRLVAQTVGDRLDQIRARSSIAAQAAAVGRTLMARNQGVADALANANYANLQTRVLDILNTTPTRDLFAQSDRVLRALVGITRTRHNVGHPRRTFMENIAQALRY